MSVESCETYQSSSVGDGDEYKPAHSHHLKLLALSEALMRSPVLDGTGGNKHQEQLASSSVVRKGCSIGLLEEARNRWRGRKERYVHWDTVQIGGKEFPLQRADTSSIAQRSSTPTTEGGGSAGGRGQGINSSVDPAAEASYLLIGHSTCDMCLMTYESSSVSGVITMKRILEARREWGLEGSKSKKYAAASNLYEPARLCALCSQYFCAKDAGGKEEGDEIGELMPCGVGRSDEQVSLSLESMASNKPLPDKGAATAALVAPMASGMADGGSSALQRRRRRDPGRRCDNNTSSTGNGRNPAATASNFQLDELIADDRFTVEETDLARQPGAVASQSSTADGMGADVCMGFPAAKKRTGAASRSPMALQQVQNGSIRGRNGGKTGKGNPSSHSVLTADGSGKLLESTTDSSDTTSGPRFIDGGNIGTNGRIQSSCQSVKSHSPASAASAAGMTAKEKETALRIVDTIRTVHTESKLTRRARSPSLPPTTLRADEAAAAAAAAARTCSRTRREKQPWWEVDLGGAFPVRCIRVHHPDRRTEATKAGASPFVDVSPFWIMTSAGAIGDATPEEAKEMALSTKRVASHGKVTVWNLGVNHFAAAVRVQAEGVKSLQLARVQVIKGGGTQQAKDVIQQQLIDRTIAPCFPKSQLQDSTNETCSAALVPGGSTLTTAASSRAKASVESSSKHKMVKSSLLRFYHERGDGVGAGEVSPSTSATPAVTDSDATCASKSSPPPAGAAAAVAAAAATPPSAAVLPAQMVGFLESGRKPLACNTTVTTTAAGGGKILGPAAAAGVAVSSDESYRAHTCPTAANTALGSHAPSVGGGGRCSTTGPRRRPRGGDVKGMGLPREDVQRLLLRAVVGYDWVDEFNGKDVRVRGAFTEQDVVVLEEIFFRCAFGDDAEARAAAAVTDQSLRLDPGELCGDLRRLQLQVQTNPGGKGRTPMLLAIRECPNLFQLLSSSVVEALPDALVRAEAQLPAAQRPLGLDWTRFLGVMGLCLEGVYSGTGLLAPSSVARLFEKKRDEKLEFLTRRCNRLPPRQAPAPAPGVGGKKNVKYRGFVVAAGGGGARGSHDVESGGASSTTATGAGAATANASGGGTSVATGWISTDDHSMREMGSSIDTGDDTFLEFGAGGAGSGSRGKHGLEGTGRGATTSTNDHEADGDRRDGTAGGEGNGGGAWGGRRRGRGGGTAALKALLRPQARHEVFKGYGEAVSKRRERQREALRRAPEPDVEPTRAYKPCGLCQAPFPVESLGSTVSLKVLGTFLTKAGAPNERFDRKASRLCALHRLPLCVFCSQFFDPDFPGGIVPPGGYTASFKGGYRKGMNRHLTTDGGAPASLSSSTSPPSGASFLPTSLPSSSSSSSSAPSSSLPPPKGFPGSAEANGLVPFFDDRFPNRSSDTPPPSSAPATRAYSPPPQSSSLFSTSRPHETSNSSGCLSSKVGQQQESFSPGVSSVVKHGRVGGGRVGGRGGEGGGTRHVCEAAELREVGGLVRRGCSIRDRLKVVSQCQ